jgi:uncharacterized protein YrzB (UPF0473 family)
MAGPNEIDALDEEVLTDEDIVELTDDDGNTVSFAVLIVAELDGVEYAALTPLDQLQDDASDEQDVYLWIYEEVEEDGEIVQTFAPIEDEEVFERVRDFCAAQIEILAAE